MFFFVLIRGHFFVGTIPFFELYLETPPPPQKKKKNRKQKSDGALQRGSCTEFMFWDLHNMYFSFFVFIVVF